MGSSAESEPSISTTQQPLLRLPSSAASSAGDPYPSPISYTHSPRPLRDLPFLLLFLLLSLSTFAGGFVAVARRNSDKLRVSHFTYDPSLFSCVLSSNSLDASLSYSSLSSSAFVKYLISTLVITLVLLAPISISLLLLLRHFAKYLIYISIPFFILIPAFFNVYWFAACALGEGCHRAFPLGYRILVLVFVFILIAIILWIIISNWYRIELTIQIVQISAIALAQNLTLLLVLPSLVLALLAIYIVPIVIFLVFATWNGEITPHEKKGSYYECIWRQDQWVSAYFALAIVTMVWSVATMVEAQVYVISGTVAQWYFSDERSRPNKSLRSSLRNAFGSSFGTVCFSGMVFGAVRFVRAIIDSARREHGLQGFVNLMLKCCAEFLFSSFDFVNKFTINLASITGESYCSAARLAYELLRRNLLSAVFVETVSTRILFGIVFVLSSLYGIAVFAVLRSVSSLGVEMYIVSALAWVLLMIVLGYFVNVLDDVIDTVYICYAIDRDKGDVTKQEVHQVYTQLPLSRNHRSPLANQNPLIA